MCAYARAHEQSMPLEMSWASNARHARGRAALGSAGWHTHTRACMFTEARAYTQAHVHTHTAPEFTCTPGISSHSRAGVWRCFAQISMCVPETCACTQHAHTHEHTHRNTHACKHIRTHTRTRTHMHTHIQTRACAPGMTSSGCWGAELPWPSRVSALKLLPLLPKVLVEERFMRSCS